MSAGDSQELLVIEELVAGYGALEVIHSVSLHIGRGEAVALLGALALIVVKGFMFTGKTINFVAPASARSSAPVGVSVPAR